MDNDGTPVEVVRSPREVTVEYRSEAGGVVATSPQVPGFRVNGRCLSEAQEAAREALGGFLDPAVKVTGRLVPSPEEAAAADELTALTEELGLYGEDD